MSKNSIIFLKLDNNHILDLFKMYTNRYYKCKNFLNSVSSIFTKGAAPPSFTSLIIVRCVSRILLVDKYRNQMTDSNRRIGILADFISNNRM